MDQSRGMVSQCNKWPSKKFNSKKRQHFFDASTTESLRWVALRNRCRRLSLDEGIPTTQETTQTSRSASVDTSWNVHSAFAKKYANNYEVLTLNLHDARQKHSATTPRTWPSFCAEYHTESLPRLDKIYFYIWVGQKKHFWYIGTF